MRGFGQIAELTAICEPDVGVITNIGPVHLEQMKSLEGVARAKGELLAGLRDGAVAVVPAGETLLDPVLRPALRTSSRSAPAATSTSTADAVVAGGERLSLELPFTAAHLRRNLLAAVAAARAVGVRPSGRVDVRFSALRGERVVLGTGAVVINDCYNANPLSMRAALDDLALQEPAGRRVAVLGDMLELGAEEAEHHRSIGAHAALGGRRPARRGGPARRRHGRRLRRRVALGGRRRRGRDAHPRARAARRPDPRQGLARGRPRGRGRGAPGGGATADGRGAHRRHGVPAHLHLPVAQVHRLPARPRVRAAHPRGGAAGAPRQGGDAHHGRADHLHRHRRPVLPADEPRRAVARRDRRGARLRGARLRRRLHEAGPAALAGAAGAHEARPDAADRRRAVARGHARRRPPRHDQPAGDRRPDRRRATSIRCSSTSWWRGRRRR